MFHYNIRRPKTRHRKINDLHRAVANPFAAHCSSWVKHFPFARIKIDSSFVRDIGEGGETEAIVKAIIALSRSLGKAVTAESVETESQLDFLRRNACDEAQGFLLASPRPAAAEIGRTIHL